MVSLWKKNNDSSLDSFILRLTRQEDSLKAEIHAAVRAQCSTGKSTTQDVEDARAAIAQLFQKIKDIKSKAEQSEVHIALLKPQFIFHGVQVMVQEICADIKQLDYAKTLRPKT